MQGAEAILHCKDTLGYKHLAKQKWITETTLSCSRKKKNLRFCQWTRMVVSWLAVMRASRSCEYTIASTLLSWRGISSPTLQPSGASLAGMGSLGGWGDVWGGQGEGATTMGILGRRQETLGEGRCVGGPGGGGNAQQTMHWCLAASIWHLQSALTAYLQQKRLSCVRLQISTAARCMSKQCNAGLWHGLLSDAVCSAAPTVAILAALCYDVCSLC